MALFMNTPILFLATIGMNWLATRCLNCDMDVYAMDTTDSLDPSQEFRPILSCSSLKTEEEASKLRQLTNPEGGKFYSSAFKLIIFLERAERRDDLSESEPKHLGPTLLGEEFQAQLDQTLKMFTKRLQTAMQLKIEEFREEQQRKLYSEVNAAKLAAKYLLQSNRSPAPAALTPTGSQKQTNKPSSATSALQDADSDKDDFSLEASNQPHAAVESDSEDLASSFNEDLFDLDEDASRAQPPRQAFSPPKVHHHAVQEEGVVGSFAAQGRYFLTKAPKFVPTIVEVSNESSSDDELDSKISPYAKSLPIPIANFSRSAHFQITPIAEAEEDDDETFEAPHFARRENLLG
ncbi:hypothetical protein L0F63_002556 [Massospora cicadina]|nr:hypothetical protein L0F63_002556 [Massospora cicadina]